MHLNGLENLNISIQHQTPLSDFTSFQLGGNCSALLTCRTPEELQNVLQFCAHKKTSFILIGSGSNLLVSDKGINCHVIRFVSDKPLIEREGDDLIVSASTLLDDLVSYAMENSLEGINSMTGIPGTVGGAVVGNAGAFGKQIGDVVKCVNILDQEGLSKQLPACDLNFSYRNSIFKTTKDIVVSVQLSLKPGDKRSLSKERDEIFALRKERHPDPNVCPCAGSFFRNIEPTSNAGRREAAGWFLEQAGAMQMQSGGAKIFEHHANIIYKSQGCRAQDVFDLSAAMAQAVKSKFDLDLIREVRFVGEFDGMPEGVKNIIW